MIFFCYDSIFKSFPDYFKRNPNFINTRTKYKNRKTASFLRAVFNLACDEISLHLIY